MILKVVISKSLAGHIFSYKVIYDSGQIRTYNNKKGPPDSVLNFCKNHVEHVATINDTWIQKTYIYNELRKGKQYE